MIALPYFKLNMYYAPHTFHFCGRHILNSKKLLILKFFNGLTYQNESNYLPNHFDRWYRVCANWFNFSDGDGGVQFYVLRSYCCTHSFGFAIFHEQQHCSSSKHYTAQIVSLKVITYNYALIYYRQQLVSYCFSTNTNGQTVQIKSIDTYWSISCKCVCESAFFVFFSIFIRTFLHSSSGHFFLTLSLFLFLSICLPSSIKSINTTSTLSLERFGCVTCVGVDLRFTLFDKKNQNQVAHCTFILNVYTAVAYTPRTFYLIVFFFFFLF